MMSLMSLSGENSDTKVQSSAASARPPQTPPASSYRQRRNRRCHRPFDARRARCPSSPRVAAPAAIGPAQSCDPISCVLSVHPLSLNSRWPAVYPILTQWAAYKSRGFCTHLVTSALIRLHSWGALIVIRRIDAAEIDNFVQANFRARGEPQILGTVS